MNIYFLLVIIFIIFIISFYFIQDNFENHNNNEIQLELVISRYNEDLEWLKEEPFNKYPITCYNKGINNSFYKPSNMKIINIENVGRCDHTYIYHIVNNYDTLSNYIMFLPGSCNIEYKKNKAILWIYEIEKTKTSIFIGLKLEKGIQDTLFDFQIDEYVCSDYKNYILNPEKKLQLHNVRPFGKWYNKHFTDNKFYYVSYGGVIGVSKNNIMTTSKEKYITFLNELNQHSNPEVGHYFERAWCAIFNISDNNTLIINETLL